MPDGDNERTRHLPQAQPAPLVQPAQPPGQIVQPAQPLAPVQAAPPPVPRNTNDIATNVIAPAARPLTPAPGALPPVGPVVAPAAPPGAVFGGGVAPVVAPAQPPLAQPGPILPQNPPVVAPAAPPLVQPMVHAPAHPPMMAGHGDDHGAMMKADAGKPGMMGHDAMGHDAMGHGMMAKDMMGKDMMAHEAPQMHEPAAAMVHPMADPHPHAAAEPPGATRMVMAPSPGPAQVQSAGFTPQPIPASVPPAAPPPRAAPDFSSSTRIVSVGGLKAPSAPPPAAAPARAEMMDKTVIRPNPNHESPMQDHMSQGKPMVSYDSQGYDPLVGWLVVIAGPGKGNSRAIRYGMNSVGSAGTNRVPLDFGDDAISRDSHCFIVYENKKRAFHITHGGKTNLVYLNEEVVLAPMILNAGDEISIGQSKLKFVPLAGPDFAWEELQG